MTFNLLDTLTSKNDHFFIFYFSNFNKVLLESDGALIEVMGDYCYNMLHNYPNEIFSFFLHNKNYQLAYATALGYELYFKDQGTSELSMTYSEFYKYLKKNLNLRDKRIKMKFEEFDSQIKEAMKNMN